MRDLNELDIDKVAELEKGDILYSNIIRWPTKDGGEEWATAKVLGPALVACEDGFTLPIQLQYGTRCKSQLTAHAMEMWRTSPDRCLPPAIAPTKRVRRIRGGHSND